MNRTAPLPRKAYPKPTPEQVAAEAQRKAEVSRQVDAASRRAAIICLDQTFHLIGQDMPVWGQCAEDMAVEGARNRHEALTTLAVVGASDDAMRYLASGQGEFGSDRLTAIWWRCLRLHRAGLTGYRALPTEEADARVYALLCRDVTDLVREEIMHHDAKDLLRGTGDIFRARRERARKEHAAFQDRLREMARGEP